MGHLHARERKKPSTFNLTKHALRSLFTAMKACTLNCRLGGINRTLVYGPLTAMLVFVYLGGVVSLQYALRALTGQEPN